MRLFPPINRSRHACQREHALVSDYLDFPTHDACPFTRWLHPWTAPQPLLSLKKGNQAQLTCAGNRITIPPCTPANAPHSAHIHATILHTTRGHPQLRVHALRSPFLPQRAPRPFAHGKSRSRQALTHRTTSGAQRTRDASPGAQGPS